MMESSLWSHVCRALCTAPTTPPGPRPTPVFHKFVGKKAAKRTAAVATQGQSTVSTSSAESGADSAGSGAVLSPLQPAATQATPVKAPANTRPVQPLQAPAPKPVHKAPTTSGSAQAVVAPPPALRLTTIPRNRTNTLQPSTILPLAPAHIYKKSTNNAVQIAPAAPPLQKLRPASQRGKAGTPPPVAPLFPSLADASEFSKMKEQFAKIRAEREARGLLQSGSSSQDRGQYTQRPLSPSSLSSAESVSGTPSPKSGVVVL